MGLSAYDLFMNVALALTTMRLLLVPLLVLVYYMPFHNSHCIAAVIFALASITDWLDGYLARKLNLTTRMGEFLDPVADKLLVLITSILIAAQVHTFYMTIAVSVIVARELIVSALREWMAEMGKSAGLKVTMVAKIKTALQMIAMITLLLYQPGGPFWILPLGTLLLYIAVFLTLWSMAKYLKVAMPDLTLALKKQ